MLSGRDDLMDLTSEESQNMKLSSGIASVIPSVQTIKTFSIKNFVLKFIAVLLTLAAVIWSSILVYIMFYYLYIPASETSYELNFWFKPCDKTPGMCSYQYANLTLSHREVNMPYGQQYKILLDLEMPESAKNIQAGTFMVKCDLIDTNGEKFSEALRMASLKYHSFIYRAFRAIFTWPLYFLRLTEEKQIIIVELFKDFRNSKAHELDTLSLELQSRWVDLYSARLRLQADFSGIKYLMHHYPVITAAFSIAIGVIIFSLLLTIVWNSIGKSFNVKEKDV